MVEVFCTSCGTPGTEYCENCREANRCRTCDGEGSVDGPELFQDIRDGNGFFLRRESKGRLKVMCVDCSGTGENDGESHGGLRPD